MTPRPVSELEVPSGSWGRSANVTNRRETADVHLAHPHCGVKQVIHFIDALAGQHKTQHIIEQVTSLAGDKEKLLILVPTLLLAESVKARIEHEMARQNLTAIINLKAIHHENSSSVVGSVINHINHEAYPDGEMLILTMAAYDLINWSHFPHWSQGRHLFIDEIPAVERFYDESLPQTHPIITDHLVASASPYPNYSYIACPNLEKIRSMARNRNQDKVWDIFQPLAHRLGFRHWTNYVNTKHHEELLAGRTRRLQVHSIRRPDCFAGWKRVVMAGALFRDSPLYLTWRDQVEFVPEMIGSRKHSHGENLTFHYAIPGRMTKRKRKTLTTGNAGDEPFVTAFARTAAQAMGVANTEVLVLANKGMDDDLFRDAVRLPNSPHGLNDYQEYRYFVALGAFNQNPVHGAFLAALGLDELEVWRGIHLQSIYQGMMRGTLRTEHDIEVHVAVPDQATVRVIAALFPGCDVRRLTGLQAYRQPEAKAGRPRQWDDDAERMWKTRQKQKLDRILAEIAALNEGSCDEG